MTMEEKPSGRRLPWPVLLGLYGALLAILFVVTAEVVLRQRGIRPWKPRPVTIRVDPGGTFYQTHPTLGYSHIVGRFELTLADGYSFTVTHRADTLRVTSPPVLDSRTSDGSGADRRQIWLFGGSYTHGWTVDDEEAYPWLLQRGLPDYEIVNFGVGGYGTLHSLIQFREALARGERPVAAVIGYASFHDIRNTFVRSRRKEFAPWNKLGPLAQPYARIDEKGALQVSMAPVEYRPFPWMERSALVHALEIIYDRSEERRHRSRDVTRAIVEEFVRLARANAVVPAVVGLDVDPATYAFLETCRSLGIQSRSLRVNLSAPGNRNYPHDLHPSPAAHRKYARSLEDFLETEVLGR